MSKKSNLITTSVVISLMLFNVSSVQANIGQNTPIEPQETEVQEELTNGVSETQDATVEFERLVDKLAESLNDEQKLALAELVQNNTDVLQDAFVKHQAGEYETATDLYDEVLSELELSESSQSLIDLFIELTNDSTYLTDFDYNKQPNAKEATTEEESVVEPEVEEATEEVKNEEPAGEVTLEPTAASMMVPFRASSIEVNSESDVNYRGYLANSSGTINEVPGGELVQNIGNLAGREVRVSKEASTSEGTWLQIDVLGTDVKGWVNQSNVNEERVSRTSNVEYRGYLKRSTDTINTRPWGTRGYREVRKVNDLTGREVEVIQEATTQRATWLYVRVRGTNITGWIDKSGVDTERILSEENTNYRGILSRSTDTLNTKPWGTAGFEEIRRVGNLQGREIEVLREATTQRATWLYVSVRGTNITGWIDKAGITPESIISEKNVDYRGYLSRSNDSINTRPWGTPGFKEVRRVTNLQGKEVRVLKEATTQRATWLYVEVVGQNVKGWIDKAGVTPEAISKRTTVNYRGYLNRSSDTINTLPWGTPGFKEVRRVNNLRGKEVKVLEEATSQRATWLYVEVVGENIKGWIDKVGIKPESMSSPKEVNYRAFLTRERDTLNTLPWGIPGYKEVRRVGDLVNKEIHVTKETVTDRATWVYVTVVGEGISGWVDKDGIVQASIAYRTTLYPWTFNEVLDLQMKPGYSETDAYGNGWQRAKREDVAYYLNSQNFVDINKSQISEAEFVQITASSLNVRKGPAASYDALTQVKRNEQYELLSIDKNSGWLQIKLGNNQGWVSPNYVAFVSRVHYLKEPTTRIATVTADNLNVRKGASTNHESIAIINKGQRYEVLGEANGWYQIETNKGIGWTSGGYLEITKEVKSANYQFLSLSSPSGISVSDLNKELEGKGILVGQGAAFIEASRRYNINEVYLLSHALLETGHGTSQLANGVVVNGVRVYNMFGVGAYDGQAVAAGSQYAYEHGWDTPAKAIIGGADFISKNYINSPIHKQDTLYKMKWDPAKPTDTQYATDIRWAVKQTNSFKNDSRLLR